MHLEERLACRKDLVKFGCDDDDGRFEKLRWSKHGNTQNASVGELVPGPYTSYLIASGVGLSRALSPAMGTLCALSV